jgi:hypothetical protein
MITIPAPIEGMLCDDCYCPVMGWIATATETAHSICLECFTEWFFVYGVPAGWVKEFQ